MTTAAQCLQFARTNREAPMWARCIAWAAAQNPPKASFWRRPYGFRVACVEDPNSASLFSETLKPLEARQRGFQ